MSENLCLTTAAFVEPTVRGETLWPGGQDQITQSTSQDVNNPYLRVRVARNNFDTVRGASLEAQSIPARIRSPEPG